MSTKTITIPSISCGHCTNTIEMELGDLAGVTSAKANVDSKKVTISWEDPANWEQIDALLHEINFPPQQLIQL